jgi:hypothetical protein
MENDMTRMMMMTFVTAMMLGAAPLGLAAEVPAASGTSSQAAATQMSDDQIRDHLALNGYTVQRMKHEGDKISITATGKDGATSKLLVDAKTGRVTKADDDDDDDDD